MTTRYVIHHLYRIDGVLRRVPQLSFIDQLEAEYEFSELTRKRPNRCYELVLEDTAVLLRSAAEPESLTYNPGGSS